MRVRSRALVLVPFAVAATLVQGPAAAQQPGPPPHPCHDRPEAHQLDFWIGQWDVTSGGKVAGTNDVHPILEHCVVFENWSGAGGGNGKSFNFYDASRNVWRQVWVADSGGVLELTGGFEDGAMRLHGEARMRDGTRALQRLTLTPLAPDTVRQLWESSSDGGATWKPVFDGLYVRRR